MNAFDADCPKVGTTAQHGYACQLAKDAGFSSLLYAVSCATRQSPEAVRLQAKLGMPMHWQNASAVIKYLKARAEA